MGGSEANYDRVGAPKVWNVGWLIMENDSRVVSSGTRATLTVLNRRR